MLALAALAVLCLLLKIHAYALLDARLEVLLAEPRSSGLVSVFTVVTTMGDVVPTLLIATALAMAFHQRSGDWLRALVLPVVVIVQVAVQFLIDAVVHDPTVADVHPSVSIGGAGPIPSGSVARLFAIFFVAAYLWQGQHSTVAGHLRLTGCILVLVELVSRLYLGRHFFTDIAGGLLLGVLLASAFAWVLAMAGRPGSRTSATSERVGTSGR